MSGRGQWPLVVFDSARPPVPSEGLFIIAVLRSVYVCVGMLLYVGECEASGSAMVTGGGWGGRKRDAGA